MGYVICDMTTVNNINRNGGIYSDDQLNILQEYSKNKKQWVHIYWYIYIKKMETWKNTRNKLLTIVYRNDLFLRYCCFLSSESRYFLCNLLEKENAKKSLLNIAIFLIFLCWLLSISVQLLHKAKKFDEPSNPLDYCHVSLLSFFGKVLESLSNAKLVKHLISQSIL